VHRELPDDHVEQAVGNQVDHTWEVKRGLLWLSATPEESVLAGHGWKLHLSTRAAAYGALLDLALPVLVRSRCAFKAARSAQVLSDLNDGYASPAAVGKAVTAYPAAGQVRELGLELARALAGHLGPRVLSDRRVRSDAPVYYRYGAFTEAPDAYDEIGRPISVVHGPLGQRFESDATLQYRQPSWILDPFTGQDGQAVPAADRPALLGERYRVTAGIREAAQGNVYRAVDETTGEAVVVKQGRAYVAERTEGNDARMRLRNERRILQALADTPGVPRFVDHFSQGGDEFLVTDDCGVDTLANDVLTRGPYRSAPGAGERSIEALAAKLAAIVGAVHARDVVMRDLTPNNIVLDGAEVTAVDFGLSAFDGLHLPGGTPGYAPARQFRDEPPRPADDLHALGLTLMFAGTGLDPVTLGRDDEDLPRARALDSIHARLGSRPTGVWADIADLLADETRANNALTRLRVNAPRPRPQSPDILGLPAAVHGAPGLYQQITASLRADLLREVERILAIPDADLAAHDLNLHGGAAGIGWELLHHGDHEGVADRLADLAEFTAQAAKHVPQLPPGLYSGAAGIRVFLAEAQARGIYTGPVPGAQALATDERGDRADLDLIEGAAGLGLAHLRMMRHDGDPDHLAAVRRCIDAIEAGPAPDPGGRGGELEAVDPTAGAAHGLAGIVQLYVALAHHTGLREDLSAAARRSRELADRSRALISAARSPSAHPLAGSWCQGLAGVSRTLHHASVVVRDLSLAALARQGAEACLGLLPRTSTLGQCCGAAGIGSLLIDIASGDPDDPIWSAADQVATHLLLRSAGPPDHPVFVKPSLDTRCASWAMGTAGFLAFFRRLAERGGLDPVSACPT
jgi:serine/threonine protein kinase